MIRCLRHLALLGTAVLLWLPCAPARAILLGSYDFENNVLDSSGNGHHGTLVGGASIVNDPVRGNVLNIPTSPGTHGVNIDAVKPIPNFPAETSITLMAWYRRSADPGGEYRYVVNLGQNGDNPIATLGVRANDTLTGYIESDMPGGNSDQVNVFGQTTIEGGASAWSEWHHLAIVYDRTTDIASTYVDGVFDGATSLAAVSDTHGFSWPAASIGYGPAAGSVAPGLVDDVRIYTEALTGFEVAEAAGIGYEALRAVVDRATGEIVLESVGTNPATFDYYQLTSESHSLNPGDWNSLSDQGYQRTGAGAHQRWQEMGGSDQLELGEVFLASYSSLDSSSSQSIGLAYNTALNGEDLVFRYKAPGGNVVEGEVVYVGAAPPDLAGDFNLDGLVDVADYTLWRNNVGGPEWVLNGNGSGTGVVDGEDYNLWKSSFGASLPAAATVAPAAVPEPAAMAWVLVAGAAVWGARRIKR